MLVLLTEHRQLIGCSGSLTSTGPLTTLDFLQDGDVKIDLALLSHNPVTGQKKDENEVTFELTQSWTSLLSVHC